MMEDDIDKLKKAETSTSELEKMLELELIQKRAQWQQQKARRGTFRTLSFFFLFLVVVAALAGFFFFFIAERPRPDSAPTEQTPPSP